MENLIQQLQVQLQETLLAFPTGIREFDLIRHLCNRGDNLLQEDPFRDELSLFQTHFLLFHVLYRLQQTLTATKTSRVEISSLHIQLSPYVEPTAMTLETHDPLQEYYLNLDNLKTTSEQDVQDLLESFWKKFAGLERRQAALVILELEDPVSTDDIRQQYRRLAMKHHPDRGGDKIAFQEIAMAGKWLGISGK